MEDLKNRKDICQDRHFWTVFLVAPLFWLLLVMGLQLSPDPWWPIEHSLEFLTAVLVYPVVEELFFRGILQGWLKEKKLF
ncbi:MAG: CPBP family glutamic-type intramembrane protease [Ghiorsea sp.]|nr:CPBP family glutamic-type intramembrane protease [Ghiorsea sp.]